MKRAIVLALAMVGCQQTATVTTSAFLGTNDIVLADQLSADGALTEAGTESVNRYLVVTSTNSNELRVLDLQSPSTPSVGRTALRGPNPLEALSIPVLDRPTDLSIDTRYENGVRRKGALVYVTRQGSTEVSIVGMEPGELRELRRLATPAPVTAITNLMADATNSRLFVATFDGLSSSVLSVAMPGTSKALRTVSAAELTKRMTTRLRVDGASILALLALPGLPGRVVNGRPFCAGAASTCLVVSSRRLSDLEVTTSMVDLETLESVKLEFESPVRALLTAERQLEATGTDAPLPGALVYGVLDEGACASPRCGGVAAVDTRSGAGSFVAPIVDGVPSRPVRWSDGIVRGVSVIAGGEVPSATGELETVSLLGVMTMSNGEIVFFDGLTMSLLERDTTAASLSAATASVAGPWVAGPVISGGDSTGATLTATIGDGAVRTQRITVTWKGELGTAAIGSGVSSSFSSAALASRLRVGDRLTFSGTGCGEASITSVAGRLIQFTPALGCSSSLVTARAGATEPLVITGSLDGFLGRSAPGTTFSTGTPFMRVPGVAAAAAKLVLPFGTQTDTSPPAPGTNWGFDVIGSQLPLVSVIDPSLFTIQASQACVDVSRGTLTQLQLPGSVVFDALRGRVFSVYPSSNVVAEYDAKRVVPGGIGPSQGVSCYR